LGAAARAIHDTDGLIQAESVVAGLLGRLRDGDANVRLAVSAALCSVGYPLDESIRAVARAMLELPNDGNSDTIVRRNASRAALKKCGPRGAVALPLLVEGLKHPDPEVRLHAIEALLLLGIAARPTVPALVRLLDDP